MICSENTQDTELLKSTKQTYTFYTVECVFLRSAKRYKRKAVRIQTRNKYKQSESPYIENLGNFVILQLKSIADALMYYPRLIEQESEEKAPSFLMVLTAIGGAYQREDGVYVAPINLLRP